MKILDGDGNVLFEGNQADIPPEIAARCGVNDDLSSFKDDAYPDGDGPVVTSLADSIEPLVEHFNAQRGKNRFVAILSATCPLCVSGARAVRDSIIEAQPDGDFSISIVWIDMVPGDSQAAVSRTARLFNDPRVTQFYDQNHLAGDLVSSNLLNKNAGPAWDIYMFYDEGASWNDSLPAPSAWYHQLSGTRRADPELFRTGAALVDQLRESANAWSRTSQGSLKPSFGATKRASMTKEVEFLYIADCPNFQTLRERLVQSLQRCGTPCSIIDVDLAKLPDNDDRLRFGSPTVLFHGRDLFGSAPSSNRALACRVYSGGAAPAIADLCAALCETVCDTPADTKGSCCAATSAAPCCTSK